MNSNHATCNSFGDPRPKAGIDWLEIVFPEPLQTSKFLKKLKNHNQQIEVWNGKPGWYLRSQQAFQDLRLRILSRTQTNIATRLVVNPNRYQSYQHLREIIDGFIPQFFIQESTVSRIDLNVDIPLGFSEVRKSLDIKFKKGSRHFTSGIPTGIEFGKGEEKLVIYDRGNREHKIPEKITRIELRLKGRKLPIKNMGRICSLPNLLSIGEFKPFKFLRFNEIRLKKPVSFRDEIQAERFGRFQSLLENFGYAQSKKILSRHRNFFRDYGDFIEVGPSPWNLHQILTDELLRYFNSDGGNYG